MQHLIIKDFNVLIYEEGFFNLPVKNKKGTFEKLTEISKNNAYTTGNLLTMNISLKNCKPVAINLSKRIELENPDLKQQINSTVKLEEDNRATMFFNIEKSEETTFEFWQGLVSII